MADSRSQMQAFCRLSFLSARRIEPARTAWVRKERAVEGRLEASHDGTIGLDVLSSLIEIAIEYRERSCLPITKRETASPRDLR